ncbi:MAG: N-acetyltransferase [Bacteroidetes bacterium]|nr:MAG: N-acetyltransferase [Bacteroidota bacterium]
MEKAQTGYISSKAQIGKYVKISPGVIINDNVEIGDNSFIGPYSIIGEPTGEYYKKKENHFNKKTKIGENAIIRSFTTIYEDVIIGKNFQTGHHAVIREKTKIGNNTSFGSFSEMPGHSKIGNFVRIHSKVMLSEYNEIEDFVWIFPFVVLTNVKHPPIGEYQITKIKKYAQIFSHSIILPGITIGENAIIGAGSLVTKDVSDEMLVVGNPSKSIKSVRDIKDENGNFVYPWKDYLKEFRGYPWQEEHTEK